MVLGEDEIDQQWYDQNLMVLKYHHIQKLKPSVRERHFVCGRRRGWRGDIFSRKQIKK